MKRLFLILCAFAANGCSINLLEPNNGASLAQPTPVYTGTFPKPWILYDDTLHTGGGAMQWADYWRVTLIDFAHTSNPYAGTSSMRFTFDPTVNPPPPSAYWTAVVLIHTADFSTHATTPGKDLSPGGFVTCNFYARASAVCTVEFAALTTVQTKSLTTSWQAFSMVLPAPATQTNVKDIFRISQPNPIPSATDVFIDQLSFE